MGRATVGRSANINGKRLESKTQKRCGTHGWEGGKHSEKTNGEKPKKRTRAILTMGGLRQGKG